MINYKFEVWSGNTGSTITFNLDELKTISFNSNFKIRNLENDIWNASILKEEKQNNNYYYELQPNNQDFGFNTLIYSPEITELQYKSDELPILNKVSSTLKINSIRSSISVVIENNNDTDLIDYKFRISGNLPLRRIIRGAELVEKINENDFIIEIPLIKSNKKARFNFVVNGFNYEASIIDLQNDNSIDEPENNGRPSFNTGTGFYTKEGKIYDSNGEEFICFGVNLSAVWFQRDALNALDFVKAQGFNLVRIVWRIDFNGITNDEILYDFIEKCIELQMVPMIELHDFTGSDNVNDLVNRAGNWYSQRANSFKKYEKYLMINIANEFGSYSLSKGNNNRIQFPSAYTRLILRLRNAGIKCPLVIDPFHYGKDYTLISEYGQEILDSDPEKNIIYSVHFYAGAGENVNEINECFESITQLKLPLVIGEFGDFRSSPEDIKEDTILQNAVDYNVGLIPWGGWCFNQGNLHDLTFRWNASNLNDFTPWGRRLIYGENGIKERNIQPASSFNV